MLGHSWLIILLGVTPLNPWRSRHLIVGETPPIIVLGEYGATSWTELEKLARLFEGSVKAGRRSGASQSLHRVLWLLDATVNLLQPIVEVRVVAMGDLAAESLRIARG